MQRSRCVQKMRRHIEMFRQFHVHEFSDSRYKFSVHTDVFVPNLRMIGNVPPEHLDAFARMGVEDFDPVLAEPVKAAAEIHGLADDHGANAKLADEAAAIPAGSQGGHHDFVAVGTLAAGLRNASVSPWAEGSPSCTRRLWPRPSSFPS